ncbi:MAG: carbon storage regulator [Bacillota bacterium]|jgi:carbon storage regulator
MLILSRKTGESILVGEKIEITILECQGEKVKIGIDAPDSIKIVRNELWETEKVNLAAAQIDPRTVLSIFKNKKQ